MPTTLRMRKKLANVESRTNVSLFVRVVVLVLFNGYVPTSHAIKWLAIGNVVWNSTSDCAPGHSAGNGWPPAALYASDGGPRRVVSGVPQDAVHALSRTQKLTCLRHIDMMPFVSQAARNTMDLCQELFADRRWNCSSITHAPHFLPDLTGGSREQAFVYSLSSAALVHSIVKACSSGQSAKCHCATSPGPDDPAPSGHRWGGCSDDLSFASTFGQQFTDSQWTTAKRQRSKRAMVNLHNNDAGRQILASHLRTTCKCHGVSGACTIKTCWRSLPDIRVVASAIQRRHAVAVEVKTAVWPEAPAVSSGGGAATGGGSRQRRLVPSSSGQHNDDDGVVNKYTGSRSKTPPGAVGQDDLVYYTISPDYCLPDASLGSVGTRNRECRRDDDGPSGCQSMCCGRGYTTVTLNVTQRCDCKYYWCCYVRCKTCSRIVQLYRCR